MTAPASFAVFKDPVIPMTVATHFQTLPLPVRALCSPPAWPPDSPPIHDSMRFPHCFSEQVRSGDGMGVLFQPLSLRPSTTVTILPISSQDLACGLDYTRFLPFGYKEITFDPPQKVIDPPARVSWQIPERLKSLKQLKFLTSPSPGTTAKNPFVPLRPPSCLQSPLPPFHSLPLPRLPSPLPSCTRCGCTALVFLCLHFISGRVGLTSVGLPPLQGRAAGN